MTLPAITRSLQKKISDYGQANDKFKSSKSLSTADGSVTEKFGDRLKVILVFVTLIIAMVSLVINYWAPIEEMLRQ